MRSPLGEWHNAAPAGRYSAKAIVAARGRQHTSDMWERRGGPGYSAPPRPVSRSIPAGRRFRCSPPRARKEPGRTQKAGRHSLRSRVWEDEERLTLARETSLIGCIGVLSVATRGPAGPGEVIVKVRGGS